MVESNCPMCGKPNPEELETCQFCEAHLKTVTDALSRSQPPIQPGKKPTPIDTSELEPVLPQWLRKVRQQSRDAADEAQEQTLGEDEADQSVKAPDLLAGLHAQAPETGELPNWLIGLGKKSMQAASEETVSQEDDQASLQNELGEESSTPQERDESPLPGWISSLSGDETETQADEDEKSAFLADETKVTSPLGGSEIAASGSDLEWAADFDAKSDSQTDSTKDESDALDRLSALSEESIDTAAQQEPALPDTGSDTPEWLTSLEGGSNETAEQQESALPGTGGSTTDWLTSLESGGNEPAAPQESAQPAAEGEVPDWLSSTGAGEESTDTAATQEPAQPAAEGEMPDWLSSTGAGEEGTDTSSQQEPAVLDAESDTPDWLASLEGESDETAAQHETAQPVAEGDMPDWLSSIGEESTDTAAQQEPAQPVAESEMPSGLSSLEIESNETTPQSEAESETPDWLASIEGEDTFAQANEIASTPTITTDESAEEISSASAGSEGTPSTTDDVDAIFSMVMPDWLSKDDEQADSATPASGVEDQQTDNLSPAELPSWVQAMRPVESAITETDTAGGKSLPMEENGPLAGLRGVLPAVPGVGPSSKPKAYSMKLQASEDQQSSAAMLEKILAEEVHPKPMVTQQRVISQRGLRWFITFILLLIVGGTIFTGTQINPMPASVPLETTYALRYIQETLPPDAPVLLIFDYEASLAGELEATAAPLVDHMLLLKHPRLSLISSTPTGTGLAERFMENTQASHNYQRGQQFSNLGYIPGGASGVLAFSGKPVSVKPFDVNGEDIWNMPVLQDVKHLSDYAAIILLTGDAESARIWIEQTEGSRGDTQFLVVSSAQSGPMILPYAQSGQVDGMVTGLDGGASVEQANSGRPGMVRRYWDAYGFGLLSAVAMIVLGSLLSLASGWQIMRKKIG